MSPLLSVIVVFHDMRREAPRTLFSLSRAYQRGIDDLAYEVIAIDSRSREPLQPEEVAAFGPEFTYIRHETESRSPVEAINRAAALARGSHITVCIDGARILSPGVLRHTALALRLGEKPVVAVLGWHLGPKPQRYSMLEGYDRTVEDALLAGSGWREDGYRLFDISCLANSSADGWFLPLSESNCVTVSREMFAGLGGFDDGFRTVGGGLANLDFFKRACAVPDATLVVLLGEGCFHQFHGGAATNAAPDAHPAQDYKREYQALRGEPFQRPQNRPLFLGELPVQATRFLRQSLDVWDSR